MTANLSKQISIQQVITPVAGVAGTSDISGASVDMSLYQSVLFEVVFGVIAATAVTSIKVQQRDTSTGTWADLEGTGITVANTDDGKIFFIDVVRPMERFVRVVVARATANAAVASASALAYEPRQQATAHGATVSGEIHFSPVEGTA